MRESSLALDCRDEQMLIELYVDGELGSEERRELESHLQCCSSCASYLEIRASIGTAMKKAASEVVVPRALTDRVRGALDKMDRAGTEPSALAAISSSEDELLFGSQPALASADETVIPFRRRLAARLPILASAAALALFVWVAGGGFAGERSHSAQSGSPVSLGTAPAAMNSGPDQIDDAVVRHARALPLELINSDPARMRGWARGKVDFNPRLPRLRPLLRPVGARLSHVLDRPAVYFSYSEPGGGRAGLFVFAQKHHGFRPTPKASVRRLGAREVSLANRRGYNVVTWHEQGIVYTLVSDLDEPTLLRMVNVSSKPH